MSGENVRCYVVSVSTDLDNPLIFGPYTRRKAKHLAEAFNASINEDDFGWIHATAMRIANPPSVRQLLHEFGQ